MRKNRKPRILFIVTLPPPVHGSAVVGQQLKDSRLIRELYDCDFLNLSTSRQMDEIGKKNPVKLWRLFSSLSKELWMLITRRYDLCYISLTCHGAGFLKDAPFALLCKMFGRKLVIHQHNKGMSGDTDKWPYRWLLPMVYCNTKVILLSWRLYPDVEKIVPKKNVFICPNGLPAVDYEVMEKSNPNPRLLFLSNLMRSKGVLVLLDALTILKKRGSSFICDVVGGETKEISKKRFNEEIKKRGLEDVVVYHGPRYGNEKESLFESADIFVHPTLDDCFPLVILEAMSHGIPIISTDEGGIPDIVRDGENGLICKKNDPASLANPLKVLLKDKALCDSYGRKGREFYKNSFTLQSFELKIKGILDSCINEGF